jgi:hypothetical protein
MKQITPCLGVIVFTVFTLLCFSGAVFPAAAGEPEAIAPKQSSGFYYTIQKGDTLWDLSEKFYFSRWDWPGLWELNKEIKNPHWIQPGKKIRVFLKPDPPVQQADLPAPANLPAPAPAPETAPPPPIVPAFVYSKMSQVGFIKEKTIPVLGTILKERDGKRMIASRDIVYITPLAPGLLIPGRQYQVFTTRTVNQRIRGERFKGITHIIKADIRVTESNDTYVTAVITHTLKDVHPGDRIMAYYEREPMLTVQENPPPVDGALIESQDNTLMINDYSIAFINRGKDHGVRPGQIYSVLKENRAAFDKKIRLDPLVSGRLIVLHTEPAASTVMIVSSRRDIHPGDRVR